MVALLITAKKDFPGGTMDRNLSTGAGDTSSIPGLRRFHMPYTELSLCTTFTELVLQDPWVATAEAHAPGACAPKQEKPLQWEASAPKLKGDPHSPREGLPAQQGRPSTTKKEKKRQK